MVERRALIGLWCFGFLGAMVPGLMGQEVLFEASLPDIGAPVALGDLDGDGFGDLAVSRTVRTSPTALTTSLELRAGRDGRLIREIPQPADIGGWEVRSFGEPVIALGDLDGDGVPDLAVGLSLRVGNHTDRGFALCSGSTGHVLGFHCAWEIAAAGDVDADGCADYALRPVDCGGWAAPQRSAVRSGRTGQILREFALGDLVLGAGDVNRDGHADLLVSEPGAPSQGLAFAGQVVVYSGKDGAPLWRASGVATGETFGRALGRAGDVDGDGIGDLGVIRSRGGVFADPRVRILSGSTGDVLLDLPGSYPEYRLLRLETGHVAAMGDLNGDGHGDFAVGDRTTGPFAIHSGRTGNVLWRALRNPVRDRLSLAGVGDINGDGLADLAAVRAAAGVRPSSRLILYSGDDLWLDVSAEQIAPGGDLELVISEGMPGLPTLISVTQLDGQSVSLRWGPIAPFSTLEQRSLQTMVAPGLSPVQATLQALVLAPNGELLESGPRTIRVE